MKRRALLGAISASMVGMAGCLGATEYTLSKPDVEQTDDPLRIDAALSDRNLTIDGPATLTLTLENTGDTPLRIRTMNVWPFGLPMLEKTSGQYNLDVMLLSDRYEEMDSVNISYSGGFESRRVRTKQVTQVLEPAKPVSQEYTLRGDMFMGGGGTYELQGYGQRRTTPVGRQQQGAGTTRTASANDSQQGNSNNSKDGSAQPRSPPNNWQYLFKYQPEGGDKYYAYQPTMSITISSKSLIPL